MVADKILLNPVFLVKERDQEVVLQQATKINEVTEPRDNTSMTSATHQRADDTEYIPDLQSTVVRCVIAHRLLHILVHHNTKALQRRSERKKEVRTSLSIDPVQE